MATERSDHISQDSLHDGQDTCQRRRDDRKAQHASTQTDTRLQGYIPRLSKVNMFTLLSLWMESFPKDESEADRGDGNEAVHRTGVVVVKDGRVVGLHCSGPELHAGQVAIVSHGGGRLSECQLYFSRRPCATCLKLIINAGVSQITFWPGDPEVSLLRSVSTVDRSQHCTSHDAPGGGDRVTQEAALDAVATERLKSISRPNICFLLEPLAPGLTQFIDDTSRGSDFMERVSRDDPGVEAPELFSGQRRKHLEGLSRDFLVGTEQQHRGVLTHMGLENFCLEPWFTSLRQNMRELLGVLASVAAGVPLMLQHGFYSSEEQQPPTAAEPPPPQSSPTVASCSTSPHQGVSQEVARHCIVQARLLSYQTEDPKAGVGAVIWAKGRGTGGGTGQLYLLGCGYNAYPVGSPYAEYRQLDIKQQQQQQQERQKHKYRYSIHAEQNALTFRTGEIRAWEPTMMFVTKCPCDECVPLIRAAGITHIYTTDQDSGKDKGDISYLRFGGLKGVRKFVWQKKKKGSSSSPDLTDGLAWKHDGVQAEEEKLCNKKRCQDTTQDTPPVCN